MVLATHLLMSSLNAQPVVTVSFGAAGKEPLFNYRMVNAGKDQVEFRLMYGDKLVNKGFSVYPGGYVGFTADLVDGFAESTMKSIDGNLDKFGQEEMRDLVLSFDTGNTSTFWRFRGSLDAYGALVRYSPRLQHAFTAMSRNQPKMYRLWQDYP